jgi:RNA polymerase sporulation-specific sigma factor
MGKILSPLEMEVLRKYIEGKSYNEVAEELNRSVKSVDNALQRVKNKLEKLISSERGE